MSTEKLDIEENDRLSLNMKSKRRAALEFLAKQAGLTFQEFIELRLNPDLIAAEMGLKIEFPDERIDLQ